MLLQFEGNVVRCLYNTPDYKIYSMDIDSNKYPSLHLSKYGTITITGNFQELESGIDYYISAEEVVDKKYGVNYKVHNISLKKPDSKESSQIFLSTILTPRQANTLLNAYPNIIQKIIDDDIADIDFTKLKGIKQFTFDIIKKKVVENFVIYELVDEFKQTMDFPILMKLYEKYNSTEKIKIELQADPYKCLTQISRVGFIRADGIIKTLYKKCNEMIKNGEKPPINLGEDFLKSPSRCLACVQYCIEEVESNGDTKIDLEVLLKKVQTLAKECSDKLVEVLKDKEQFYIDIKDKSVSLRSAYETELYIAHKLLDGQKQTNLWECDVEKYRNVADGVTLTDEQLSIVDIVCKNNISILSGISGAGKSTSVIAIIRMCKDLNKTFQIVSFSAKAAKVIASYTHEPASTIHRCLLSDGQRFGINISSKLTCDIVIVDETSMIGIDIFERLIESINFTKTKLLLVGDHNQLAPISCGNVYYDIIHSNKFPMVYLSKAFRYGTSAIATVGTYMVNSQPYLKDEKIQTVGTDKAYYFINADKEDIHGKIIGLYKSLIDKGCKPEDIMVLSAMNKNSDGSDAINKELQPIANKNITPTAQHMDYGGVKYYVGDIVMQVVNNYHALNVDTCGDVLIPNGESGTIVKIQNGQMYIKFDNATVVYNKENLSMIKLGYCISVAKSQGSGSKIVIYITPQSATFMTSSNLMYVAVTRAKQYCYHIGNYKTVNLCIKKKDDLKRKTNLLTLLLNTPADIIEQYTKIEEKLLSRAKGMTKTIKESEDKKNKFKPFDDPFDVSANDFLFVSTK